ncbi:MAG: VOC family protein [Actinomycetota bacterium]
MPSPTPFGRLDHVAIVVPDTDEALAVWRDLMGFPLKFSEVVQEGTVRLTHLELGNTDLQLVQPLTPDHPLQAWLAERGIALHHLCFEVDDVDVAFAAESPYPLAAVGACPHQGTLGRRAVFLDNVDTSVVVELSTGQPR